MEIACIKLIPTDIYSTAMKIILKYFSTDLYTNLLLNCYLDKLVSRTLICHNYFWHIDVSSSYISMMTDFSYH